MIKSDMLRSPKNDSLSGTGDGGRVLGVLDTEREQVAELFVRQRLWGKTGGGDGGSRGAIDTRPAIRETL